MARVTKINVGGTNYDIAHEGELKNSGFEVVTSLPTTGLFAGREVFYRGKKYLYNGERWLYPIRFHQIADDSLITEPGWYNIGYYDNRTNYNAYYFDGILTISSAYSHSRGTSAIIAITSSYNEICITQLSGYNTNVIPQIRIVRDSNIRFILQFQYATTSQNPVNITYTDYRSTNPYRNPFKPLFGKSDIEFEEAEIVKVFTITKGVKTNYNVEGGRIIKTGGTATQMLMADGSTKDISGFATVATSGSYNDLIDKPILFSGSYEDLTDKPTLATVATSGSYNDLIDKPTFSGSYNDLTDKPTLFSGSYDDLTDKPTLATVATSGSYDDLLNKPDLVFSNIGGNVATAQITDGSITNAKLANSSMTLNDTTVNLGDTAILPWYVDYNEVDYPARIRDHWLQIYRNGVWANLVYLGDILPTQVGQITSLDNLDWYNEQVSEYEVDSNTTTSILNGTTMPASVLLNCLAEQLTLNLYPISGKQYGKGSLDSLISDLQGKGFSVFVENDLDAILSSGSDYLVRLKISKVPTAKAIIECYVAR